MARLMKYDVDEKKWKPITKSMLVNSPIKGSRIWINGKPIPVEELVEDDTNGN